MNVQFFGHTIRTEPADGIEPGHQIIYIGPVDIEAQSLLCALTGITPMLQVRIRDIFGITWVVAPHNAIADERITQLVDICADLRFTAPDMLQLSLLGDPDAA